MSEPPRPIRPSDSSEASETESSNAPDTESSAASDPESPGAPDSGSSAPSDSELSPLPSVREVMGEIEEKTEVDPKPDRVLEVDDRRWKVRVIGSTRSGAPGDAGAPLLLLRFSPEAPADRSGGPGEPAREGWAVGSLLAEVPETDLVDVLERARPVKGDGSATGSGM